MDALYYGTSAALDPLNLLESMDFVRSSPDPALMYADNRRRGDDNVF